MMRAINIDRSISLWVRGCEVNPEVDSMHKRNIQGLGSF